MSGFLVMGCRPGALVYRGVRTSRPSHPRPVLRRGDGRVRDLEALLPGRVDRCQRDETLAVSCLAFGQGVRKGRADSGDRRAQAHQATMLVVLAVLDVMQARLRDGRHFEWPAELLGVVGDDDLKTVGLGLGVQLDALRARPALELVDVDDVMCLQQDAHDLGAAATGIATGRHTSVPFFGHPPTAPVGAA